MIRIEVVSRHPIIRAGIQSLLRAHSDVVTCLTAPTGTAADVVIYDVIGLHLGNGCDLELALRHHPGRVLALSRALQPGLTARALDLGVVAAIPISADAAELLAAVQATVEGRFQDGSAVDLANRRERDHFLGRDVNLSHRQREVLALIVAGASNREIASELHLSTNTIKSIIRYAYLKIGTATRAQAVAWGVEHGFPTSPPRATDSASCVV